MLKKISKYPSSASAMICNLEHFFACLFTNMVAILHKKCSFPFRISSVNVTRSPVSSEFGHVYR